MKLSQKLLALGGVTLADYACCPYDDYGMPHALCTAALPEKTPFSLETDWQTGACKAWESNVDATYDGNDNGCDNNSNSNENWGSCGFQRHFPWNQVEVEDLRNRNCKVTLAFGTPDYTGNDGCHCQGGADSETTTIQCKTSGVVAGQATEVDCSGGTVYVQATHGGNDATAMANDNICCDPTFDVQTFADDGLTRVDCLRTCTADDVAWLANPAGGNKPRCYESDFLGRRNIQDKSLWLDMDSTNSVYATTAAGVSFSYSSTASETTEGVSNALKYNLGGVPFLGGVCKLFVPVPMTKIVSVQIAGVHVALHKQSVFPAKVDNDGTYVNDEDVGTAYCFSVVNPAEGMYNDDNGIHNGNVAGGSVGTGLPAGTFDPLSMTNDMTSLTRQAGLEPNINFFDGSDSAHIGTQLEDTAGTASGDSKVGANFDIVVHIHSEWCNSKSFWNYADMQLTGDFNNGNMDYPINAAEATDQLAATEDAYSVAQTGAVTGVTGAGFTHAHMDLMDKRNNMVASFNNVYEQTLDGVNPTGYLNYPNRNDDAFLNEDGLPDATAYAALPTENKAEYLRWPNAGAFAAFYSFVACANPPHITDEALSPRGQVNEYAMIYSIDSDDALASLDLGYASFGTQTLEQRTLVMSQTDSDYRDESCDTRTFRGNVRQVGNEVTVCGPGQLPDTDNKRCTWNWNYNAHAYSATDGNGSPGWVKPKTHEGDAEEWFDRNDPHSFDMWSTRKRRSDATENERKYAFNMGYWGAQEGAEGDGTMFGAGIPFISETASHAAAIQVPITTYDFNLKFKTARNAPVPNGALINSADCFMTLNECKCRPSVAELNAAGFEKSNGDEIVFGDDYATDYTFFTDVHHEDCNGGTPNTNSKELCNPTELAAISSNLQEANNENVCQGFKNDATSTEGYYFPDAHSTQSLTFDAGLGSNSQVKTAFNPTGDGKWEVQVHCNQVPDQATIPAHESQRDNFPDCFFGDELWFTLTYGTGNNANNDNNLSYNTYASAWFSEADFTQHVYMN